MTFQLTGFTMRFLSYFSTLLVAVSLTACGGGGGSAGTSAAPRATLATTAPAILTVGVGASQTYAISGGKSPFAVSSSNVQVSIAGTKDNALTIGGIAPGAATITVVDADAKTATIAVTVANLAPFATNAPAALTLVQGTTSSFSLSGGVPGYSVVSGDNRFVTATVTGTTLNISAVAITFAAAAVPIQIVDAAGTVLTIAVTVTSSSTLNVFTTAPAALSVGPLSTTTFTIGGGTPPYSVVSDNTSAAVASINGTVLTITSFTPSTVGAGNVAKITVRDANAQTATPIVVTVTALPFALSASTIKSFVGDVIDVSILGGTPPYRVFSPLVIGVSAALLPSGNVFRLTLNAVSVADVLVFDASNQQQKLTVTVIAGSPTLGLAPSSITVSENDNQDIKFTVLGAAPGTLSVFSSDTKRLQASISGNTVTVRTGSSRCVNVDTDVNIDVIDSKGAKGTAVITIKDNNGGIPLCP